MLGVTAIHTKNEGRIALPSEKAVMKHIEMKHDLEMKYNKTHKIIDEDKMEEKDLILVEQLVKNNFVKPMRRYIKKSQLLLKTL
jgi:hypothetical protein